MDAQHDADFVVVGSGLGGLTAGIVAADAGLSVVVVERSAKVGGVTAASGGLVWVPLTRYRTEPDSADRVLRYLEFVAAGHGTSAHRRRFVEAGPEAVHYLADHANVRWTPSTGFVDNFYPWADGSARGRALDVEPIAGTELGEWQHRMMDTPLFSGGISKNEFQSWGGMAAADRWDRDLIARRKASDTRTFGRGLMAYLVRAALVERKIPVLLEHRADALVVEDGAVVGITAFTPGGDRAIVRGRRGVLLATGGYDWKTQGQPEELPSFGSSCPPIVTGDHLVMAGEIGAEITVLPPVGFHTEFGYRIPGEEYEGAPLWRWLLFEAAQKHSIIVNDAADRFCDEAWFYHCQAQIREFDPVHRRYRNLPAFFVFDQNHRDKFPFGPFMPGQELPDDPFVRADDLTGLAHKLGLDPHRLGRTVHRFNGFCESGQDDEFGRGSKDFMSYLHSSTDGSNPVLGPIGRAPFYGLKLGLGGLGANQAGLRTDDNAVVQHLRGRPIQGLYAAGNAAAHLDFGPTYLSGGLCARGLVWGYVAARHAASELT